MASLTQNNKIAVAAVSIFFLSFSAMLFFMDRGEVSPDYLKSSVLEAEMTNGEEHSVYFSEGDAANQESEGSSNQFKKTEDSYRKLINKYYEPFFVLKPEGKAKFLSENFSSKYGYELDEIDQKGFFSYMYPEDLPDFVTEYTSVIQSGKAVNGIGPFRFINKDGKLSVHIISLLPVIADDGKVVEVIGCIKDITSKVDDISEAKEQKEAEEAQKLEEQKAAENSSQKSADEDTAVSKDQEAGSDDAGKDATGEKTNATSAENDSTSEKSPEGNLSNLLGDFFKPTSSAKLSSVYSDAVNYR
jgi:PAS domain S-box-containing protein